MKVAFLIYDEFTALDAVGPYEVLWRLPGAEMSLVAKKAGITRSDTADMALRADRTLDELTDPDIVLVPGGDGAHRLLDDDEVLDWLRSAHEQTTWTTSVCTGALILGAARILDGLRATTHWGYRDRLRSFGAEPVPDRVVFEGKVVTAAGVSSGIDMALRLAAEIAGEQVGQAIQLGIEYDPQPPFDAGSPEKAPPELVEFVRQRYAQG